MQENSAGAIIYTIVNNELLFLLSEDFRGNIGFAKGHLENDETYIEAATREIKEEVGIDISLDENFKEDIYYPLSNENIKHVTYFLGFYENQKPTIQIEEVNNVYLLPYKKALSLLTFDVMKKILSNAYSYILNKNMMYVTAYGDKDDNDRGIFKLSFINNHFIKDDFIQLHAKSNMIIEDLNHLYISLEYKDHNELRIYNKDNLNEFESFNSKYFYSYGNIYKDRLYLASYSSGVDSIFDLKKKEFIKDVKHIKDDLKAKSHYIKRISNNRVISIENGIGQIYEYDDDLNIKKIKNIPNINIRLLSLHHKLNIVYLNTEISNEVLTINLANLEIIDSYKMSDNPKYFSGGNSINEDDTYLCISLRGENTIYIFDIDDNEKLSFKTKLPTPNMPRDTYIKDNILFVTCTLDNVVEAYDLNTLNKIAQININQPITFNMK